MADDFRQTDVENKKQHQGTTDVKIESFSSKSNNKKVNSNDLFKRLNHIRDCSILSIFAIIFFVGVWIAWSFAVGQLRKQGIIAPPVDSATSGAAATFFAFFFILPLMFVGLPGILVLIVSIILAAFTKTSKASSKPKFTSVTVTNIILISVCVLISRFMLVFYIDFIGENNSLGILLTFLVAIIASGVCIAPSIVVLRDVNILEKYAYSPASLWAIHSKE